jgi:lysophospholipase L1-like esterase
MARPCEGENGVTLVVALAGAAYAVLIWSAAAFAEGAPDAVASYTAECQAGRGAIVGDAPLPNVTVAIEDRKRVRILAIGASAAQRAKGSYTEQIEQLLENTIKGVDVVMINRAVSGELAREAAMRIRTDVALSAPDLVLWQVGTNDALARVPFDELEETLTDTIRWLRHHNVDVVLAGLQYIKQMAQDAHYRAVRELMRRIADQENVIIVRRYEPMPPISGVPGRAGGSEEPESSVGYRCLAQYFARAITIGIFGKARAPYQ